MYESKKIELAVNPNRIKVRQITVITREVGLNASAPNFQQGNTKI